MSRNVLGCLALLALATAALGGVCRADAAAGGVADATGGTDRGGTRDAVAPTGATDRAGSRGDVATADAADGRAAANRVIIGMQLEPPILDPTASPAAAISEALYGNVFEGLVQFAADGSVVPQLAETWEVSADGLLYTFHLRHNVSFHDGQPFDSSVVQFSLRRALAEGSVNPQKSRLQAIRAIETIDPYTVRIVLNRRSGALLQSLAWGCFVMVAPPSAMTNAAHPVGTGPFRFADWRRGDSLTLERNTSYWGMPARLDEVTFKFIADPSAAYAALMAGDIDAFDNYPAPESFAQFAADPRFRVFVGTTEGETILALNNRNPPLDKIEVRRAIAYAIDRHALIDGAMFGYGTPIGSHFPPRNPAYVDLTHQYPHDTAKAKQLLAEAGYPAGFAMTLKLPPPSYARRGGEIIAAQLAQVGIRVRIENLEWAQWLDQVFAHHDFDMSIVVHAEPMDYDIYARDDYYFGYSDPAFKTLIARLDDTIDPRLREDLLRQIQHKLADDAVNGFLFQYPKLAVWNAQLQGVNFDNVLGVVDLKAAHYGAVTTAVPGALAPREIPALTTAVPGGNTPREIPATGARGAGSGETPAAGALGVAMLSAKPAAGPATSGTPLWGRLLGWFGVAGTVGLLGWSAKRFGLPFLAGRVGVLAGTIVAATAVVFVILQIVPGDPVRYMMGLQADPAAMEALRRELGLDAAPLQRYLAWMTGLLHGDFGSSYTYRIPVARLIAERLQVSLPLALYALLLSTLVAFPVGLIAAARRGRASGAVLTGTTQLGLAIPNFWLGMLLVLLFAVRLHWVSAGGFPGWYAGFWAGLKALTLPAIALAMPQAAILARVLRGALITTLHEDYIRTARAKGAGPWRVLWRHALPNALIPVITILGMQFSFLLAGGVIIENVFFLPGLGRLVFQAIVQRDLIVVQSVVVLLVLAVVLVTFVVDLAYGLINPRLARGR